jgi:regulator of protease activity HflC (stomatin/prohibitin superfamily)
MSQRGDAPALGYGVGEDVDPRVRALKSMRRWVVYGAVALAAVWAVGNSYYVVEPNEVGAVTRMGSLVTEAPAPPGFHLKLPFIDTAHKVRMSIEKIPIPDVKAKTTDNQFVGVDLNITYHTQDPFRVLFKVGEVGPGGVHDKVIPYVQSRVLDEIGKVNALEITGQKSVIEANILKDIRTQVLELFGEFVDDVQVTAIDYDPAFKQGVEKMVQTRNDQVAAQNVLVITKTQAETAAAKAKGEADALVNAAEGEKQKAIKAAEAQAAQIKLQGDAEAYATLAKAKAQADAAREVGAAEAAVIANKVGAAGGAQAYQGILQSEAMKNWNGSVPTYSFGGGGVAPVVPLMNLAPPKQ